MDLSKVDLSQAIVCYSKCTPCQFQSCPGEPHTWMESEDLDHENRHPSTPEEWDALTAERPCGCRCMADYLAAKKALKSATTEETDHGDS